VTDAYHLWTDAFLTVLHQRRKPPTALKENSFSSEAAPSASTARLTLTAAIALISYPVQNVGRGVPQQTFDIRRHYGATRYLGYLRCAAPLLAHARCFGPFRLRTGISMFFIPDGCGVTNGRPVTLDLWRHTASIWPRGLAYTTV